MNYQNPHSDKSTFGEQFNSNQSQKTYEYVFSNGFSAPTPPPKKKRNGNRVLVTLLTVLLCITCSFAAGYSGAMYAKSIAEDVTTDQPETNTPQINESPADSELLNENPTEILDKDESQDSPFGSAGDDVFSVMQVVQKVEDAVVVIDVTITSNNSFFGSQTSTGSGSGVIISPDGYILTCHHVVDGATSVRVTLNSGSQYEASLVGSDAASDLAVLRIAPKEDEPLTYVEQGCSADLAVGEHVVAIGNPLGTLGGTVTDGIISAKERNITTSDGTVMTLLQTNAAINSGNSGGGLFNLDGKLIGIVNAKYAAEGVEGLAFAIPIDSAYEVELDLIEHGYVRGIVDHGLSLLDITSANLNYYYYKFSISKAGVYVVSSEHNEDLKNKDRIISVDGVEVTTEAQVEAVIEQHKVGDVLKIVYERDGKQHETELTLQEYVPDYVDRDLS